ncbi:MAG: rRNA maturation RNase YbeY [Gemmatimonadaceae bacterium]|nr:rRNA maturation RNase YbeY [Gemmatimonadaceae bacterium]
MAVAAEGVRVPVSRVRVAETAELVLRAERIRAAELSITFVTDRHIATLNREHLGHAGATDVITFVFSASHAGDPVRGDVYIAPVVARRNARAHGAGVREELLRLVVHGVLHVAGHVHPEDGTRTHSPMWRRQELLLRRVMAAA